MNCIIIGDYGTADKYQKLVADSMVNLIKEHKIKFICGLGDNIYDHGVKSVGDNKFYSHFEEPYKDIKLRFYQCIGNHDYGTIYFNHIIPQDYKYQIEYTNYSKKWYLPKRYYYYSKKMNNLKIDFFVLDTNVDLMNKDEILEQLMYFKEKISKSNASFENSFLSLQSLLIDSFTFLVCSSFIFFKLLKDIDNKSPYFYKLSKTQQQISNLLNDYDNYIDDIRDNYLEICKTKLSEEGKFNYKILQYPDFKNKISLNLLEENKMPFGKYKGELIDDLDDDYIEKFIKTKLYLTSKRIRKSLNKSKHKKLIRKLNRKKIQSKKSVSDIKATAGGKKRKKTKRK